jgi:spermidine dehydrogenase
MNRKISRRDLLNGLAIGVGSGMLDGQVFARASLVKDLLAKDSLVSHTASMASSEYPPTLTGMRGSHVGSFEVAHNLAWRGQKPANYQSLDEHYDLVVVGAGMSGLAAAWYYRKKVGPKARILILDNHDDFGGHAKRNEFHHEGRMVLGLGAAQNIENVEDYSYEAAGLLSDIGIDASALATMGENVPENYMLAGSVTADMGMAMQGEDGDHRGHVTVNGQWMWLFQGEGDYVTAVRALPIPSTEQDKLITLIGGYRDVFQDLSALETWRYIKSVSYNQFLSERVGLAEETIKMTDAVLQIYGGYTGWNYSVREACMYGSPGFRSMGWVGRSLSKLALPLAKHTLQKIRMFPDGNASVARLLVQKMVPGVAPNMKGFEDVVTARFDYSALDSTSDNDKHSTRIRLNSTAVGVRQTHSEKVEVDYVQKGQALRITAKHCILACYNGIIPHLCPQLPQEQIDGLKYGVKTPFVYANVLLRNGHAFSKLGATTYQCPMDPFQLVTTAPPVSVGGYQPPRNSDDPMLMFMMSSPLEKPQEGMTGRDASRMGRHAIYSTPFEAYEQKIRTQLQSLLGPHGFDHEVDIQAITVNRISHGYAYSYTDLYDPKWEDGQAPHEIGRKQFGNISIANSDSEAAAQMNSAFDAAWRAVQEQLA